MSKKPSLPSADGAGAPPSTSTKGKGRPKNPLARGSWPFYSPEERLLIETFLAACLADIEEAVHSSFEFARGSPGGHTSWKTHEYWNNAAGITRWLFDRAGKRQLHLALAELARQEAAE